MRKKIVEPVWKQVNREEFKKFLASYPRRLDADVTGICDPPLITYNDFALADRWPDSVVAKTYAYDENPDGYFYLPEEKRRYDILVNHEEMFAHPVFMEKHVAYIKRPQKN